MAYENAGQVSLAELTYESFRVMVASVDGSLKLMTIDNRSKDVLAPVGLRRYRESLFPAPVFVMSGNFAEDSEIAREWLELHKAHVRDADADRPQDQLIR